MLVITMTAWPHFDDSDHLGHRESLQSFWSPLYAPCSSRSTYLISAITGLPVLTITMPVKRFWLSCNTGVTLATLIHLTDSSHQGHLIHLKHQGWIKSSWPSTVNWLTLIITPSFDKRHALVVTSQLTHSCNHRVIFDEELFLDITCQSAYSCDYPVIWYKILSS